MSISRSFYVMSARKRCMFTRNQIDLTDDSLLLFGVLDHLGEIRADQSGDSLNEIRADQVGMRSMSANLILLYCPALAALGGVRALSAIIRPLGSYPFGRISWHVREV